MSGGCTRQARSKHHERLAVFQHEELDVASGVMPYDEAPDSFLADDSLSSKTAMRISQRMSPLQAARARAGRANSACTKLATTQRTAAKRRALCILKSECCGSDLAGHVVATPFRPFRRKTSWAEDSMPPALARRASADRPPAPPSPPPFVYPRARSAAPLPLYHPLAASGPRERARSHIRYDTRAPVRDGTSECPPGPGFWS